MSQENKDKGDAAEARTQQTRGFMQQVRVASRRKYTPEEKVRIVLEGFRREVAVNELCRREGIKPGAYYAWTKDFMEAGKERLTRDTVLETPHYSSRDSWADPTHVRHFSLFFTDQMCGDGYLVDAVGRFELIGRRVNFGPLFGSMRARLISSLRGYERWERSAFTLPARNIFIDLRVIK